MRSFHIRGYHPLRPAFPCRSAPHAQATGLIHFRSPLLAESPLMSVPPGTEMFQFPRFASPPYVFRWRYPKGVGCPIRTSRDQSLLAAPPGFSQRATSFIASWRQGIHQMPFSCSQNTWPIPTRRTGHTHHAQEPSTPSKHRTRRKPNPTAGHTHLPPTTASAGHHTQHTHKTPLIAAAKPALSHASPTKRTSAAWVRHPCQNSHGHPQQPRTRPHHKGTGGQGHPRCPARPETHQNLIHNHQRTHARAIPIRMDHRPGQQPPRFAGANTGRPDLLPPLNPKGSSNLLHDDKPWWRRTGSNRRPPACKAGALPAELRPQHWQASSNPRRSKGFVGGGPGRTRTSDPTLIKRVL